MQPLSFAKIKAAARLGQNTVIQTGTEAFKDIFRDTSVPPDPDRKADSTAPLQVFNNTPENQRKAAEILQAAASAPVVILSDIDGTASRFARAVEESRLVPGYLENALRISRVPGSGFYFITGRGEEDARAILGRDSEKRGDLPLPAIISHGTVLLPPDDGKNGRNAPAEIELTEKEKSFVLSLHAYGKALEQKHDARIADGTLRLQYKPSGLDVKDLRGNLISEIAADLAALCKSEANPGKAFAAVQEGALETSVRHENTDKARAIREFILEPGKGDALFIYIGDSMGATGTDRRAAEFVQKELGGIAIEVLNGRPGNMPEEGSFKPDLVLPNPEAAAAFLDLLATGKEGLAKTMEMTAKQAETPLASLTAAPAFAEASNRDSKPSVFVLSNATPGGQGGLVVAVEASLEVMNEQDSAGRGAWIGRARDTIDHPDQRDSIAGIKGTAITQAGTGKGYDILTLPLTHEEARHHYHETSNGIIWPLYHDLAEYIDPNVAQESLEKYGEVDKVFAQQLAPLLRDNAENVAFIHDYHLLLVPRHLRQMGIDNPILFFNHIPLPDNDFLQSPVVSDAHRAFHEELVQGLFDCDVVGFQTMRDLRNFRDYIGSDQPLPASPFETVELSYKGKKARFGAFPISVETAEIEGLAALSGDTHAKEMKELEDRLHGRKLILSVERYDYTKGLDHKAAAIDEVLETIPEYRDTAHFMQIAPYSRDKLPQYQRFIQKVGRLMENLIRKYALGDEDSAVSFRTDNVHREALFGYFRRAAVGFVAPLKDGQNLVAKEYVAAQDPENPGVLVLSKFAGAAEELAQGALLIDPRDKKEVAAALRTAMEMPLEERKDRHRKMMTVLRKNDIRHWATQLMSQVHRRHDPLPQPANDREAAFTAVQPLRHSF